MCEEKKIMAGLIRQLKFEKEMKAKIKKPYLVKAEGV